MHFFAWIVSAICLVTVSAVNLEMQVKFSGISNDLAYDRCLKFIHIPRNAGTSIDSINLNFPKDQRIFESLMEGPIDRAAGGPLFPNETPGHLFDTAHGSELTDESSETAAMHYGPYLIAFNFTLYTWEYDGYNETCQDLHTPPHYNEQVEKFFTEEGCTNFCVVRDPMTRLVSAYKYRMFGECNTESFNQWILNTFPITKPINFCHTYPQIEYVYNSKAKKTATKQWCQRMLRFENLENDFNNLMEEFGIHVTLNKHLNSGGGQCIDVTKLSKEAKDRVYEYYRADYDAFDYPRPE